MNYFNCAFFRIFEAAETFLEKSTEPFFLKLASAVRMNLAASLSLSTGIDLIAKAMIIVDLG